MRTCPKCQETKKLDTRTFKLIDIDAFDTVCKRCRGLEWRATQPKRDRRAYHKEYNKRHYVENKEHYHARNVRLKDHYAESKRKEYGTPEYKARERARHKERWSNPTHRVSKLMSNKVNKLIRDKNHISWVDCVPYTLKELMAHLEAQFRPGMTWDNYGPIWHIDHIRPISWFSFESKEDPQFRECWALSNLQPLFKHENLSKSDRYEGRPELS